MANQAPNTGFHATGRSLARALTLSLIAFGFSESAALAQSRVPIRPTPKPGQVIHVTAEQQVLLRLGEKPEEPGPSQMNNKNVLAYTQTNGQFDSRGLLDAQVTIDRLELNETVGAGQKQAPDASSLKGRIVTVTLDRTGKLLGISVPPDINNALSLRVTQLLAGSYGMLNFVPAAELAIGQDTTASTELPIRLPGSVSQGPMQARTRITLRAIDKKGTDRIAHLQQEIEVATASSELKVTGGGTIDVNLDKGFLSSADVEWRLSGTIPAGTTGRQSPPFFGSIRIAVTAN